MSLAESYVVYTPDTVSEADDLTSLADRSFTLHDEDINTSSEATIYLQEIDEDGSILVSVEQPKAPAKEIQHVGCDIVLVIDVSGSMGAIAPLPDVAGSSEENSGLSILDLTKHAARTILESLDVGDRVGIVTFDNQPHLVQSLEDVTAKSKKATLSKIELLALGGSTNLWSGIRTGLDVFRDTKRKGNAQGLFVLTDGMPNCMCPPQGYVPKLKPIMEELAETKGIKPIINTFGFGYSIRSGLMQSIAETGNGSYAFMPDAGMIGTVFVHAIANLFTTYAVSAELTLSSSSEVTLQYDTGVLPSSSQSGDLSIGLGALQYGQSRDVVVRTKNEPGSILYAQLTYQHPDGTVESKRTNITLGKKQHFASEATVEYHVARGKLISILASLFPCRADGEHFAVHESDPEKLERYQKQLLHLANNVISSPHGTDSRLKSIHDDINGESPMGQILLALGGEKKQSYWNKWGKHYLPSLLHAHTRQLCNTFKDPGPLQYGKDSPLFIKSRDKLDKIFESLPAPKPTVQMHGRPAYKGSMKRWNSRSNPCFDGQCLVVCADGSKTMVKDLRVGQELWTPSGDRKIHAIVRTLCPTATLCHVGDLWITPWHPVIGDSGQWVFPVHVVEEIKIYHGTPVYSIMLDNSSNPDSHAINVGGQIAVTLGHGIVRQNNDEPDVRAHAFFGDYELVARALSRLPSDSTGVLMSDGVVRNISTGLAEDFTPPSEDSNVTPGPLAQPIDRWELLCT